MTESAAASAAVPSEIEMASSGAAAASVAVPERAIAIEQITPQTTITEQTGQEVGDEEMEDARTKRERSMTAQEDEDEAAPK
eukprot:6471385-Amphidinium_carterae.1